jgi:hypothetical protein
VFIYIHSYLYVQEPRYDPDVVCGTAVDDRCSLGAACYHVNFLAIPDDDGRRRQTLFFAEFRQLGTHLDYSVRGLHLDESEPAFCLPVPLSAQHLGRCFLCEGRTSRILHPATGSYYTNAGKGIKDATVPFLYWNTFGAVLQASVDTRQRAARIGFRLLPLVPY